MSYDGTAWILRHPDTVVSIIDAAITAFDIAQSYIGLIQTAQFDGTNITSAVRVDGTQCQQHFPSKTWVCAYSIEE